jgi:hypothetical protein
LSDKSLNKRYHLLVSAVASRDATLGFKTDGGAMAAQRHTPRRPKIAEMLIAWAIADRVVTQLSRFSQRLWAMT